MKPILLCSAAFALVLGVGSYQLLQARGLASIIGYGDVLAPDHWRSLGAIEGAAGPILLGWSIAYLVSLLAALRLFRRNWLSFRH